MTKHFLIQSIRLNERHKGDIAFYNIQPIVVALKYLPDVVDNYNKGVKRTISFEVYGTEGQQTAVITLRGPKARVKDFPTALATTNFYKYFSLREVKDPDYYIE